MSLIVDRTCTEIEIDGDGQVRLGESKPLAEFRSVPAFVLLGDPGAGKTTAFETECEAIQASERRAEYVKARDFFNLHVDSHPEWRGAVLFIDGLDEIRAGSVDSRAPFDKVRSRLDQLRPPAFRISCREADWLGNNDRHNLEVVAPDSSVTVVRLDPLDADAVRKLLASRIPAGEVAGFIDNARSSGVWSLLQNPLTLQLMMDAIHQGDGCPQSKRETFEMACEKLATEQNPEHLLADDPVPPTVIMDAAGYLSALQLLSGLEGYSLLPSPPNPSFRALHGLDESVLPIAMVRLRRVLATRLFTAVDETGFLPVHRQVAEFLGGRYLARLVGGGLPARRVVALMISASDGRVVTPLRGLSAWLAAYSDEARSLLIDADPVGVGMYGDISGFNGHDKKRLLGSLATFATQGSLGDGDETAWAFRSLVSEEMVPAIGDVLKRGSDGPSSDRVLEFVLRVLSNAEDTDLSHLVSLLPYVEAILWDPARRSVIRQAALEAYIRVLPPGDTKALKLRTFLDIVHDRTLPDPDDQLAGTLLRYLYPDDLSPAEVWRYAVPPNNQRFVGRFRVFWKLVLLQKSSHRQTADLLDALHDDFSAISERLQYSGLEDLPLRLLEQGLQGIGDDTDLPRLYRWLTVAGPPARRRHAHRGLVDNVRIWLEARPRIQKEILLNWLRLHDSPGRLTFDRSCADDPWQKELEEVRDQGLEEHRLRATDWAKYLSEQEVKLRANTLPPSDLHTLALVHIGESGSEMDMSAQHRIGKFIGGDPGLVEAVMGALTGALWRDDLPDVDETIALHSQDKMPYLAQPVLTSMGLLSSDSELEWKVDADRMSRALAIYYNYADAFTPDEVRACHDTWFQDRPGLVLDVLYRCAVAAVRKGDELVSGVYELDRMTGHDDLLFDTRLRLLDAFLTRIPNKQLRLFDGLLGSAIRYADNTRLKPLAEKKLTMSSLSVAQRVRWMTVNALVSGGQHTRELRAYVGANERRIRQLAEFFNNTSVFRAWESVLRGCGNSEILVTLVEMLGSSYGPQNLDGFVTLEISTSEFIEGVIRQLSVATDADARNGLARLVGDPHLGPWHRQLTWAQERQRIVYRDASYSHPSISEVQNALSNRAPANAADLAALLSDRLCAIAEYVQGDNTNPWRQFWNEDRHRRPTKDKPEESCRDVLLETLKQRLPRGIDAVPEGRYAAEKRADIRASFGGFNVPIEIKKNTHRDLWSALRRQLVNQYTRDPATSGYGIYLVLWFGADRTLRHLDGNRPETPGELARQLQQDLTIGEARKISVIVIDVTKPG